MKTFREVLIEKLTLAYHGTLNQKLFDGDVLKPEVKDKLLEIARAWQKFSKIPDDLVQDIIMTGGNCAYNYTKYSDIDVHIVMNKDDLFNNREYVDEYLGDKKTLWALTHNNRVKGYPIEMYSQDSKDHLVASGVYSLLKNEWLTKPVHGKVDFKHDDALQKKVDEFIKMIDNMISDGSSEADFKIMKEKLKNMRNAGMASGNEFSFENNVFKELRNQGVLNKMNAYLQKLKDKDYSLD